MKTPKQCESILLRKRGLSFIFCTKNKNHKGDHRGYRAQWNRKGKRVPITEELPR